MQLTADQLIYRLTRQTIHVQPNSEGRSFNHCWSEKSIRVTYCDCVCKLSYLACNAHVPYCHLWPVLLYNILHIISWRHDFRKKSYWTQNVFRFPLQHLSETFLILRRTERYKIKSSYESVCKIPVILVQFYRKLLFLNRVSKNIQISNFMKIVSLGAALFHVDRRTSGRTDMTKLRVAFRKFANAPKNHSRVRWPLYWLIPLYCVWTRTSEVRGRE
jgi:hypothetical protein